jgi:hypothetical protein
MHPPFEDVGRPPAAGGWRGHRSEIVFLVAVWLLALAQVALIVVHGGTFALDGALALAFALVCPLALLGFRHTNDATE